MYILDVIPISRGISKEFLSYLSFSDVSIGHIVKVPLRNKTIPAIVVESRPAADAKAELRSSGFNIKKIQKAEPKSLFTEYFVKAAHDTANHFAGTTGSVLNTLVPKAVIEGAGQLKIPLHTPSIKEEYRVSEKMVIQAPDDERIAHYKSLIRESFARKLSVIVCLPTIHDIKKTVELLPKGIEEYTYVLHSGLPKKELVQTWTAVNTIDHPILIIGTGASLALPRNDIGIIIIEKENSSAYKTHVRPFIDIRTFAEYLAKHAKAKIVFGDTMLRVETLWRYNNHELVELLPVKFRSLSPASQRIIDMRTYKAPAGTPFIIFSDELKTLIKKTKEQSENLFLYGSRRGLSPMTVCADCGNIVYCENCSAPIVLHTSTKGNFFLCHKCGERRNAEEKCKVCDSWRLTTLGVGLELIEERLEEEFPDVKVFRIDKDTVKTLKQGLSVIEKFNAAPGSILLGTDLALLYLNRKIENAAIVSVDSLFSVPDYRIHEKIMSLVVRIRSIAEKEYLIQTRNSDQHIWSYAIQGNLMDFYREELQERERYEYPPFWTFIKITAIGEKAKVAREMKWLEEFLKPHTIHVFPAFIERVKGKFVMHAILKLKRNEWIDKELLKKLRDLPHNFIVRVDPDSLL